MRQRVGKFIKFGSLQFNHTVQLKPQVRFTISSIKNSVTQFDITQFQSKLSILQGKEIIWTVNCFFKHFKFN